MLRNGRCSERRATAETRSPWRYCYSAAAVMAPDISADIACWKIKTPKDCREEAAAVVATAYAKFTGKLGVCLAKLGPAGTHMLNWWGAPLARC